MFINLTPFSSLVVTLPLLSPSPDKGGGTFYIRGASPLFDSPLVFSLFKRDGEEILEGASPLHSSLN